ncbi:hypothetical protein [Chelatococcus reniformis]|uniref:Uncharacterized protein n=1 Tax=Chelatococcus reniformis TaxID=1494448 RepID=A0A916U1I7_9HYPH|nr:hypothetical protein [Chelatococcus reniformis]GGC56433.1 hypothetical protein GCM10010994_14180 [Chelatococcus reniformis]
MTNFRRERYKAERADQPVILEADVVGEQVMIRDGQPQEPFWGPSVGRWGKRLLFAAVALAVLAVTIPLALLTVGMIWIGALIGRRVIARRYGVDPWPRAASRARP